MMFRAIAPELKGVSIRSCMLRDALNGGVQLELAFKALEFLRVNNAVSTGSVVVDELFTWSAPITVSRGAVGVAARVRMNLGLRRDESLLESVAEHFAWVFYDHKNPVHAAAFKFSSGNAAITSYVMLEAVKR